MNPSRRRFMVSGSVGVASLITGCITPKLYEADRYTETVSSILVSEDGNKIVVMTKAYHYIFDAPKVITMTLSAPYHKSVSAEFGTFKVDTFRNTTGEFTLLLDENATEAEQQQAISAGFKHDKTGKIRAEGTLTGVRYDANNISPTHDSQKLNNEYQVFVIAQQSFAEKSAKTLATPVTLTLDGILLIGAIPLFLFTVAVFASVGK